MVTDHASQWIFPILLAAVYAGLAAFFYRWVTFNFRLKFRRPSNALNDFLLYLLSWPLLLALVLAGLLILSELWPLSLHARSIFRKIELITIVVTLTLVVQQWLISSFKFSPEGSWMRITLLRKIVLFTLYTLALLMISQALNLPIMPILATLGVGSLAVALALKDILANFFAGIQLAVERPLEIGQSVTLENGMSGRVLSLGWMKTDLRMDDGSLLFVPNARMTGFIIQNLTLSEHEAATIVKLSIDRASDLARAEQVALETARQTMQASGQAPAQEPTTRYTQLGATAAELSVTLRTLTYAAIPELRSAYLKAVNTALSQAGVKIV